MTSWVRSVSELVLWVIIVIKARIKKGNIVTFRTSATICNKAPFRAVTTKDRGHKEGRHKKRRKNHFSQIRKIFLKTQAK